MVREYIIFGLLACTQEDAKSIGQRIAEGDGEMFIHIPELGVGELLKASQGWEDFAIVDKDEYVEIESHVERFNKIFRGERDVILLFDGGHGQYVPQFFAELYPELLDEEQKEVLKDKDHDLYWEIWADVMDNVTITDAEGVEYYLYQDGDLWLVPVGYELEEFTI
jgi:hypothetical protein